MTCEDITRCGRLIEIIDWKFSGEAFGRIFSFRGAYAPLIFFLHFPLTKTSPPEKCLRSLIYRCSSKMLPGHRVLRHGGVDLHDDDMHNIHVKHLGVSQDLQTIHVSIAILVNI